MRDALCGRRQRDTHDADHDREHGDVLVSSRVLAEQALREEHEHDQARGERWLHHHERGEQQRHYLERPAEHGHPGAEQPARPAHEPQRERRAQVLIVGGDAGLGCLERDP